MGEQQQDCYDKNNNILSYAMHILHGSGNFLRNKSIECKGWRILTLGRLVDSSMKLLAFLSGAGVCESSHSLSLFLLLPSSGSSARNPPLAFDGGTFTVPRDSTLVISLCLWTTKQAKNHFWISIPIFLGNGKFLFNILVLFQTLCYSTHSEKCKN